jgi:hypothetical protein
LRLFERKICLVGLMAMFAATPLGSDELPIFDVCHLFETETQFTTQTFYMQMEDVRHTITVPTVYFEDRFDRVNGSEHRAQLFRVMIDDFTPVSRPMTAELNMAGRSDDYFRFLLQDPIDLADRVPISAGELRTGDGRDMSRYEYIAADHELEQLVPLSGAPTYGDLFIDRDDSGTILSILRCNNDPDAVNHSCKHEFRAFEIDLSLSYPRAYLPAWQDLQTKITRFLECALIQ